HFWLAEHAIRRGDHEQANSDVALATKAWPQSPIGAFLKGEQLASNGEWNKAAKFLEEQAAGVRDQWLAEQFNQRARQFRENKGAALPLLDEPAVLFEFVAHSIADSAENSAASQKLREYLETAKTFGLRLASKLPGMTGSLLAR